VGAPTGRLHGQVRRDLPFLVFPSLSTISPCPLFFSSPASHMRAAGELRRLEELPFSCLLSERGKGARDPASALCPSTLFLFHTLPFPHSPPLSCTFVCSHAGHGVRPVLGTRPRRYQSLQAGQAGAARGHRRHTGVAYQYQAVPQAGAAAGEPQGSHWHTRNGGTRLHQAVTGSRGESTETGVPLVHHCAAFLMVSPPPLPPPLCTDHVHPGHGGVYHRPRRVAGTAAAERGAQRRRAVRVPAAAGRGAGSLPAR